MLYVIGFILLVLWLLGWLVFEVLGAAIHLVVIVAVVLFLIAMFKKARRAL